MGIEALTQRANGEIAVPETSNDWLDWISATSTRNFVGRNTLVDWLHRYGEEHGFRRDTYLPSFDRRTDFNTFLFRQGRQFEAAVCAYLQRLVPLTTVSTGPSHIRSLQKAEETFEAMRGGAQTIYQGVLRDAELRTYGAPDLLMRSDVVQQLFPGTMSEEGAAQPGPDIDAQRWHYVVIDIKFTTLRLQSGGELAQSDSSSANRAQLFVYNRALGRLQGYLPQNAFLLGRCWKQGTGDRATGSTSFMDRLVPAPQSGQIRKRPVGELVQSAGEWVRRMRREGGAWMVLPHPSVPELWPNMGHSGDFPWQAAKAQIAEELGELTLLWQVGDAERDKAHERGVYSWRDVTLTAETVGVKGATKAPTLQAMIEINRAREGPAVRPERVSASEGTWRKAPPLEFYVDFETVNDLADDFSSLPEKGGQTLIFMVGCGHLEGGEWRFKTFLADELSEPAEARVIDDWLEHMATVGKSLGVSGRDAPVIHWSQAEESALESSYNAAVKRHPEKSWPSPPWFDFLGEVVKAQPVVVRGSLGFGLKAVAKAMYSHGLISTKWDDGPADGRGAMVGAWWCADEARERGVPMSTIPLMSEIARYNEVDCKATMEIVRYLRESH